jgi:hypothetical protein
LCVCVCAFFIILKDLSARLFVLFVGIGFSGFWATKVTQSFLTTHDLISYHFCDIDTSFRCFVCAVRMTCLLGRDSLISFLPEIEMKSEFFGKISRQNHWPIISPAKQTKDTLPSLTSHPYSTLYHIFKMFIFLPN